MSDTTLFQYCQKLVVFNATKDAVLLAKRKGEADYDGIFSFIGGKMETTDANILEGMKREKNEEIGSNVTIRVLPNVSFNAFYRKKDGNAMVLPHIYAEYVSGEISLNDEYSEYQWVPLKNLSSFEPKIETIEGCVENVITLSSLALPEDYVEI